MEGLYNLGAVTKTTHRASYPAISSLRPELSQAGKTVLVTGGSAGIGYAIARSFVQAQAAKLIILGRRSGTVAKAVSSLTTLARETSTNGGPATVVGLECDMGSPTDAAALWARLAGEGTVVDVLVLNAAAIPPTKPLLDMGAELWATYYDVNVRAQLDFAGRFYKQLGKGVGETKYLVHVSTMAVHNWEINPARAYGLTKNAGAAALQMVAADVAPEKMQIINFHPGAIFTDAAKDAGYTEQTIRWDEPELPGDFAVWAATPEAGFLHGRFVWACWDVDELKSGEVRKRIDEDQWYLKVGVRGL
ncbi:NAD(P)-binding protein [Annulohypoxylon maeteangense]|uniref:NAD(P)-binding protein n=1 Tax=Annulohypoxylon maeteangense TaxID=1927788 RepID=UPI002008D836|nr:NAD(P)-binding protein [Annulohypoxylon maeteangense]KAI0889124.1 NAD(P)-binding protein [Annulohypoxylon maeteangense]